MKKVTRYFRFALSFLLFSTCVSYSQISLTVTSPGSIYSCSDSNKFTASFYPASTSPVGFGIRASLTNFLGGYVNTFCDSLTAHPNVYYVLDTAINCTFSPSIITFGHNCLWSDTLTPISTLSPCIIKFRAFIDCAGLSATTNLTLNQAFIDTVYNSTTYQIGTSGTNLLQNASVTTPFIQDTTAVLTVNYKTTKYLLFKYKNTGNSDANITFRFFRDTLNCLNSDTTLSYSDSLGGAYLPLSSGAATPVIVKRFNTLVIRQEIHVNSCLDVCPGSATMIWRCNLPSLVTPVFCSSCQKVFNTPYTFTDGDLPQISIVLIHPDTNDIYWDHSCLNDTSHMVDWTYRITNADVGALDSISIRLYSLMGGLSELTLIPKDSLSATCSCTFSLTRAVKSQTLCSSYISQALDTGKITIKTFLQTDTLYVHFRTFRCGSSDESALLNTGKFFNFWQFDIKGKSICQKAAFIPKGNSFFPPGQSGISSDNREPGNNYPNLDLKFQYLPSVSGLAVAPGQTWGESALLDMDLQGLSDKSWYEQIFGCNVPGCVWKGYLKAKIYCDTGLVIMNPDSDVYLSVFNKDSSKWYYRYPVYYRDSIPASTCQAGYYYFYFDLNDSLTDLMIKKGKFFFRIQACCPAKPVETPYSVTFYILPNPGGNCFTLDLSDTAHVNEPPCAGYGCAWIPLRNTTESLNILCPGCLSPGIICDRYRIERSSFGYQDSDDDGRADSGLAIIGSDANWFNIHKSLLGINNSSYGDQLTDWLTSHLQPGDNTSGGYTYPQMKNEGAFLNHLQLFRTIPGAHDSLKLHVRDFTLYIDTPNTGVTTNCRDCREFGVDSAQFNTMKMIKVTGADIAHFLDTLIQGGGYLFTFTSTHDYSTGVDTGNLYEISYAASHYNNPTYPFTGFNDKQQYRLKVNYSECGNFETTAPGSFNQADFRKKTKIINNMWLSGRKQTKTGYSVVPEMPNDTNELHLAGYTLNNPPDSTWQTIDSAFANSNKFVCEKNGAIHFFYSNELFNVSTISNIDSSCLKQIEVSAHDVVAGYNTNNNIYHFEYHPPQLPPVAYHLTIPPGYAADSAWVRTNVVVNAANHLTKYIPFTLPSNTGHITIYQDSLPPLSCMFQNVTVPFGGNTNLYAGNRAIAVFIKIRCLPDFCADTNYIYHDTTIVVAFDTLSTTCFKLATCALDTPVVRKMPLAGPNYNGKNLGILPNLKITHPNSILVTGRTMCFALSFSDSLKVTGNYNTTNAYNVFIKVAPVGYLSGWKFNDGTDHSPNAAGVIPITSKLNAGAVLNGNLCANYTPCHGDDSIKFYYGWNCKNFPWSASPDSVCGIDSFYCKFINDSAYLKPTGKDPLPHFGLCDTFDITVEFSAQKAGVQPDSIFLSNLPANTSIVSVKIENCATGKYKTLNPVASPLKWRITGNQLDSINFTDSLVTSYGVNAGCIRVRISLSAQCGYTGNQINNITLFSHRGCGDTLINVIGCPNPYNFDHTFQCTDCFTVTKTALTDTILIGDTMSFKIKICGNNSSAQYVTINELLPDTISANFVLTNVIPYFLLIPAQGCDSFLVTGYFTTPGPATDTSHINKVEITTANSVVFTDTAGVTVVEPCMYQANVIIPDSTYYSTGPVIANGDSIFVMGDWFIDKDLTLTNNTVYTGMSAHIIVMPGFFLTLDGTTITGCQTMWRGIRVEHEAGVTLENGSLVADAGHGLFMAEASLYFNIRNSSVINCVKEVYVEPNGSGIYNVTTCEVYGSDFGLRGAGFKPDYPGQPHHGSLAHTDIELNDMTGIVIGDNLELPNYFFRANRGITIIGSDVTISNSEFEGITPDTAYHWYYDGYAIAIRQNLVTNTISRVFVNPYTYHAGQPTIHDGFRGIYSRYSDVDVRNVYIRNVTGGILNEFSAWLNTVNIIRCKIEASRSGIRWNQNAGAANMLAQQNEISMSGDTTGTAFALVESSSGLPNYRVLENTITMNNTRFGIRSGGVQYPVISGNSVTMLRTASPKRKDGITVNGGDSAQITCNNVKGFGSAAADTLVRGINFNISPYGYIKCNTVDSTGWGIYFGGISLNTVFKGNNMNRHYHGLHLNNVAVIDTQSFSGNRWLAYYDTTAGSWGAVNMNDLPGNVVKSLFEFDPSSPYDSTYFPFTPTVNPNNNGWFDPFPGGGAFVCTQDNSCALSNGSTGGSLELRQAIARDTTITSDFIEESKSIAQSSLFEKLKTDTLFYATDTILQNFLNNNENQALGYLFNSKYVLNAIYHFDSTLISSKFITDSLFNFYADSLTYIDSLIKINPDSILFIQRKNIIGQISIVNSNFQALLTQHILSSANKITEAEINNNLVTASRLPEENEKAINEIEVAFLRNGIEGISSYYEQIVTIASQCPYEGGQAVFKAASLAELLNDSITFEYDAVCSQHGYFRQPDSKEIKNILAVKIIPNPAVDQIKILIEGESKGICLVTIDDAIGKNQMELSFNCKEREHTINIKNLSPGIYLVKTYLNNKSFVNKISVIR